MKKIVASLFAVFALIGLGGVVAFAAADHSQFRELQRNFNSPEDVTRTCLECHTNAGHELVKTPHWTWSKDTVKLPGKEGDVTAVGAKNVVSNIFPAVASNERYAGAFHAGYGWRDGNFNFADSSKADCLVCHEHSGSYVKAVNGAGYPSANETNLSAAARSVGRPDNHNCGQCHFSAPGFGSGVKNVDLDKSIVSADGDYYDIHMQPNGRKLVCVDCHVTKNHNINGRLYTTSVDDTNRISCEQCHTDKPHTQVMFIDDSAAKDADGHFNILDYKAMLKGREAPENSFRNRLLDSHNSRVSCQACHIDHHNAQAKVVSDMSKTDANTAAQVIPSYRLLGGVVGHVLYGDKIDPAAAPIQLNTVEDAQANGKIWPVNIVKSKQLYDTENNVFVAAQMYGDRGYFATKNWDTAAAAGMRAAGIAFSGKMDWVETELMLPVNHGVKTASKALKCEDCHSRDGRLADVTTAGWVPGRDTWLIVDILGALMILGAFAGVAFHSFMRYKASKK